MLVDGEPVRWGGWLMCVGGCVCLCSKVVAWCSTMGSAVPESSSSCCVKSFATVTRPQNNQLQLWFVSSALLRPFPSLPSHLANPSNFSFHNRPIHTCSASLFDFGLFFFHNARESVARGSGPYFYLPKMESHLEARLWNDAFNMAQGE